LGFAFLIGIVILPTIAYLVFAVKIHSAKMRQIGYWLLVVAGVILAIWFGNIIALGLTVIGVNNLTSHLWKNIQMNTYINLAITLLIAVHFLADEWLPLGPERGFFLNILFVALAVGAVLAVLWVLVIYYERILRWSLSHRTIFLLIPFSTIVFGVTIWLGFDRTFGFLSFGSQKIRASAVWQSAVKRFPGVGQEFMPTLNEGTFLLMPTSMPYTGVEQNLELIGTLDKRISHIPEVEQTVGKWGRVNSALDPALGYELLLSQDVDVHVKNAALMHHERSDGSGYPSKLKGNQIDPYARMVAIADVYDAMTAARCYRGPLCPFCVIEMFETEGFQKYDVSILLPFLENVVNSCLQNRCLLNDGRKVTIIYINKEKLSRPVVQYGEEYINLADQPDLKIEKLL
jgi:hypothetical protein